MPLSSMPWVKLYTETLDDPKMGRLSDTVKWRFIQLIMLAGECDAEGYLIAGETPLSIEDIAWRLRIDPNTLQAELSQIEALDLIGKTENGYLVTNFSKRQGRKQLEKRAQWRERQQKHRVKIVERDNIQSKEGSHASVTGDISLVTPLEEEEEVEKEGESRGKTAPKKGAKAPVAHGATTPPKRNENKSELRIDLTEQGRTLQALLRKAYVGMNKRVPDYYANTVQRDAYLEVFTRLNGSLEDMIYKGIQREITERNKLLSWLQGCAKKFDPPLEPRIDMNELAKTDPEEWARIQLSGMRNDITDYVR